MSLRDKGQIQEELCSRHKYFEWNLDGEFFDFSQYLDVTSPAFKVGLQNFYLEMSPKCRYTLRLYRSGPALRDAIFSWYAGIVCFQGSDQGPMHDGRVDVSEEVAEWKEVQRLFTVSSSYLHNSCLRPDRKITFFFQINVIPINFVRREKVLTPGGSRHHAALRKSPLNTGIIVESEWELSKKVQWNIPCKSIKDSQFNNYCPRELSLDELLSPEIVYKSPAFEISDQKFHFSLEIGRDSTRHYIVLYRMGPPVGMTVRWWMRLKNGPNSLFVSRTMKLTKHCVGWTFFKQLVSFETIHECSLSVEFLVGKRDVMHACCPPRYAAISYGVKHSLVGGQSPLDFDPSRTEFISFRSQGHDFTVHRSLLSMRVPVFEAMLSHDTVESRTGVVCVDDCEPVVVGMFLHYVDTGVGPVWCEKLPFWAIHLAAGLAVMADKYLVAELRDKCLNFLEEVARGKNSEYMMYVGSKVKDLRDTLSTFPPGDLKKWDMIDFFHNTEDDDK